MEKIKCSVASIDDPNTLDRILALMMKANASTAISDINPQSKFQKKDHFALRQKNEIQLQLTKTSENPGRKQKNIPLRYTYIYGICTVCGRTLWGNNLKDYILTHR